MKWPLDGQRRLPGDQCKLKLPTHRHTYRHWQSRRQLTERDRRCNASLGKVILSAPTQLSANTVGNSNSRKREFQANLLDHLFVADEDLIKRVGSFSLFFIFFSVVCKGRLMHRLIKPGKMSAFGRQKMQKMPKSKYLSCTCREVLQLAFYYGNSFPNCHFRAHKKKGNIYMWVSVFVVVCRLFRWFAIEHCAHTHTHTFHHSTVVSVAAERISSGKQTPGLSPHLLHCLTAL